MTEETEAPTEDNDDHEVADAVVRRLLELRGDRFGKEMVASLLNKLLFKVA